MLRVHRALPVSHPRYRRAGKVKGIPIEVEDGFHDIGIHDIRGIGDRHGQCSHFYIFLTADCFDTGINCGGLDQRHVTLDVYQNFRIRMSGGDFGYARSCRIDGRPV